MDKSKYYVYIYFDPRKKGKFVYDKYAFSYKPFYIGKGSGGRILDHINGQDDCNKLKVKLIDELIKENKKPIIQKIKKDLNEEEAFNLEKDLIKNIGRIATYDGPLTNIQSGGEGFHNWIITENWLEKNRLGIKKRWAKKENREKHKKTMRKVGSRKEFKEKSRKNLLNQWKDPDIRKMRTEIQQRKDIKEKKSIASIKTHSKTWILISPKGKRYITNRLNEFCKELDLSVGMLQAVALSHQLHHKNWLCFKKGEEIVVREELKRLKKQKKVIERNRREKLRILATGRKKRDEERRKIGEAQKGNKHGIGYKHSDENKQKISRSSKERWKDPNFRLKMKNRNKRQ